MHNASIHPPPRRAQVIAQRIDDARTLLRSPIHYPADLTRCACQILLTWGADPAERLAARETLRAMGVAA